MEIRRERTPDLLNYLANLPGVHENIGLREDAYDFTPIFQNTPNGVVAYSNGVDGVQVFEMTADREWWCTTIFGPTCRGRRALDTAAAIKAEITKYADLIFGPVPDALPAAKWFYRQLGGEPVEEIVSGGKTYRAGQGEALYALRVVH